jgi:hypothetical protein
VKKKPKKDSALAIVKALAKRMKTFPSCVGGGYDISAWCKLHQRAYRYLKARSK